MALNDWPFPAWLNGKHDRWWKIEFQFKGKRKVEARKSGNLYSGNRSYPSGWRDKPKAWSQAWAVLATWRPGLKKTRGVIRWAPIKATAEHQAATAREGSYFSDVKVVKMTAFVPEKVKKARADYLAKQAEDKKTKAQAARTKKRADEEARRKKAAKTRKKRAKAKAKKTKLPLFGNLLG